ncbi:MAG: glycosyltransferase family 2 protein, partial [Chloroflexota bacterium]|nr:glycosyltransferase family 2 protein [Chloroflexota bacterium]
MDIERKTPTVSVIIPTHNRAAILPRAVESVLSQDLTDLELIIVDDASTDRTGKIISGFIDPRVKSIRCASNVGVAAARNLGISHSQGDYITFVDDDDELTPNSISRRVAVMNASPLNPGMVYGWADVINDDTGERRALCRDEWEGKAFLQASLMLANSVPTLAMLWRASAVKEIGGFNEELDLFEDNYFSNSVASKYHVISLNGICALGHASRAYSRLSDYRNLYKIDRFIEAHIQRFSTEIGAIPNGIERLLDFRDRMLRSAAISAARDGEL